MPGFIATQTAKNKLQQSEHGVIRYMLRYHIIIHGDVQGVGFRYFTQKNASLYRINGWVRNKIDGTVEIDAEGSEMNMAEFIKSIEKGSRSSTVEYVDIDKVTEIKNYKSFHIIENG